MSRANLASARTAAQGASSAQPETAKDASRVQLNLDEDALVVLTWLSEAMDETGWTQEALAAWFKERNIRSTDRQYVQKMLTGEKSITLRDIVAMPDDLEAAFLVRWRQKFEPSETEVMGRLLVAFGDAIRLCQLRTLPSKVSRVAVANAKADLPSGGSR